MARFLRRTTLAGLVFGMPALAGAQAPRIGSSTAIINFVGAETLEASTGEIAVSAGRLVQPFTVGPVAPSELAVVAFNGQTRKNGFLLVWTAAPAMSDAAFAVEASADGIRFENVTEVATEASGATPATYCCLDATPAAQTTARRYYRLRQANTDGTTAYSPVIALQRPAKAQRGS